METNGKIEILDHYVADIPCLWLINECYSSLLMYN
jgi:hypothetical protein